MKHTEDFQIKQTFYRKHGKRIFDFFFSISALAILSPLLLLIALLVRINLGSPVLFRQKRPGLHEKTFILYKFRTMTEEKDKNGNLLPDSVRLTKFGEFLRSTSLDELPELWNISLGEMSFVGPRPQLIKDVVFMSQRQRKRHCILPGLTGLAQINGRNTITWEKKLLLDVEYLECIGFLKDCKIVFKTVLKTLEQDGISSLGLDTAEDLGDYLLRSDKISKTTYSEFQGLAQEFEESYE